MPINITRPRTTCRLLAVLLFAAIVTPALGARPFPQGETTSAITGRVSDATGAAVAGASVTILSRDTGAKRSSQTDDTGRFDFPQLKPGAYSVKVAAPGFDAQENANVEAGLGLKQEVDFVLKVSAARQTVEVSGAAPLINPQNADTSTN